MSDAISRQVGRMVDTCLDGLRGKPTRKVNNDNVRVSAFKSSGAHAEVRVILSTPDNPAYTNAFKEKLAYLGGQELHCGPRKVNSNSLTPAEPFELLGPSEWAVWFERVPL